MNRVPFDILNKLVDRLMDDDQVRTDEDILSQCDTIADLMTSCGWDETEYWEEWMRQTEKLDFDDTTPYPTDEKAMLN